jgi:1,4-alpha-glucan branching enzyme
VPDTSFAPAAQPVNVPTQWEPKTSPGQAAAVDESPKPTAPQSVKVNFVVLDLGAKQVSLSGDFNGWSPNATRMSRDSSGHWETTVDLAPGRYQYKFVVDGEWIPNPLAQENVWNQHGTLNSVVEVRGTDDAARDLALPLKQEP